MNTTSVVVKPFTLELKGVRPYMFTSMFVAFAIGLPVLAHLAGAPVRYMLPMHWTIILAGLVYGKKGGALSGFVTPSLSFMISGMPYLAMLLPMTIELTAYGFIAGYMRENLKLNSFAAIVVALIAGRILFLLTVLISGSFAGNFPDYTYNALMPGVFAVFGQIVILPFAAKWIIAKERE
jgi:uncharacterized membrane protein